MVPKPTPMGLNLPVPWPTRRKDRGHPTPLRECPSRVLGNAKVRAATSRGAAACPSEFARNAQDARIGSDDTALAGL
jgi:hypothetical protein